MFGLSFVLLCAWAAEPYPRGDLLLEADAVDSFRGIILDVRPLDQYKAGHMPGAQVVSPTEWSEAFGVMPKVEVWSALLGKLGLEPSQSILLYGNDLRDVCRIWWILRYLGFSNAKILNGGLEAWRKSGGKLVVSAEETAPTSLKVSPNENCRATKESILLGLKNGLPLIIDARSSAEYYGETSSAQRNGAIPTALHLEWKICLEPQTNRFKSPVKLAKLFKEHGIDLSKPVITYCQSGGRAAVLAFTLELMGGKSVLNYYAGWSEWGNDPNTPIVRPKKP